MISAEENERLTQVDPGTPMGDLLRHYWHPFAPASELDGRDVMPVRLLGEDLVVVRDPAGRLGLLQRACAHRGTDLAHGIVEDAGIRCVRHGWLYGLDGQCLDQPLEYPSFCHEVRLRAYEVEMRGDLLWAYLGPRPAPPNPHWQPYDWDDALVQIAYARLACNWLQCQEESMELPFFGGKFGGRPLVHETEYGFTVIEEGAEAAPTKVALWPNGIASGDGRSSRLEWRVPVDSMNTLVFVRTAHRPHPGTTLSRRVVSWQAPVHAEKGEVLRTHELNRKFAIWLSQGTVLDRTQEHLATGDDGVRTLRQKLGSQMDLLTDGGSPKRVAAESTPQALPPTRQPEATISTFPIAGQPPEAEQAYEQVIATWREEL